MRSYFAAFLLALTLALAACTADSPTPTLPPRPTPTSLPTFTPRGQAIAPTTAPEPSPTTAEPTVAPTDTSIPEPTAEPTTAPTAPPTRPQATATPRPPSPTSAPAFDYIIVEQRVKSRAEEPNLMAVNIELYAVDQAGNPLNGVVFRDLELNEAVVSGDKGPGMAQFTFTTDRAYRITVEADGSGPVTSQTSLTFALNAFRSDEVNQLLMAAGLCGSLADCRQAIHFTTVIKFQRQR